MLARVRRDVPARLVLVGDGPERARAAERARELGVAGSVCFLGQRADFAELLGARRRFVLPSESESFGVAALEALSAGVPVFGYRVGGLPEVVADDVGRAGRAVRRRRARRRGARRCVARSGARDARSGRAARARAAGALPARARALDRYEALLPPRRCERDA